MIEVSYKKKNLHTIKRLNEMQIEFFQFEIDIHNLCKMAATFIIY